jgi:hypothetical protein
LNEGGTPKTSSIIASTAYNVYEIIETRDNDNIILDIEISEIVTGTFISKVVALSFPENDGDDKEVLTLTQNGLIKRLIKTSDETDWNLKGLAFEGDGEWTGTDITIDFTDGNELILASATYNGNGIIMRSENRGETWTNVSHESHPEITAVEFDRKSGSEYAYAVGNSDYVWQSTNDGQSWTETGEFTDPQFNTIMADPDYDYASTRKLYVGGSGSPKAVWYDGVDWHNNEEGLEGVTAVFEYTKRSPIDVVYAATSHGVYEKNMFYPNSPWEEASEGLGGTPVVGITNEPSDNNNYVAVREDAAFMSVNSVLSWVHITNGVLAIEDPDIYKVAASQDLTKGFTVGTSKGVYYIGDIIETGYVNTDTWGPGIFIIKDGIHINPEQTLSIVSPCTIYVDFSPPANIVIPSDASLNATGDPGDSVLITSTGRSIEGAYWDGIRYYGNEASVILEYCIVEYANKGISWDWNYPARISIKKCRFSHMSASGGGIEIGRPPFIAGLEVTQSVFEKCGFYAIKIMKDYVQSYPSITISDNLFTDCDYGIWYSGGTNPGGTKHVNITDNTFTQTTAYTGNYGIHVEMNEYADYAPVVNITGDSISYFGGGGIFLNSVSPNSTVRDNRVKRNRSYSVYLVNSSPRMDATQADNNSFGYSTVGIQCDENSFPLVRWTKIRDCFNGVGVLIDAQSGGYFGNPEDYGNNSISYPNNPSMYYYDMKSYSPSGVMAQGNWWGENPPDFTEIWGNIDYRNHLTFEPIYGNWKIDADLAGNPTDFLLDQNFPNPFNPTTAISLYLEEPGQANLKVYNVQGQLVKTLLSGNFNGGHHTVTWDATNNRGEEVSSGIYFYVLSTDHGKTSKRMTLLR